MKKMKKEGKNQSELQKVAIFLGVLLLLLVISFFVGMYLGPDAEIEQTSGTGKGPQTLTDESSPPTAAKPENSRQENLRDIYKEAEEIKRSIVVKPKPKRERETPKENKLSAVKQKQKKHKNKEKVKAAQKAKEDSIVYAVQVGAFRSAKEAKRLAKKLKKKGYTVYVVDVKTKDKGILHKVRIGRFRKRKQADKLSRKIRKNEGIQAFVAYR